MKPQYLPSTLRIIREGVESVPEAVLAAITAPPGSPAGQPSVQSRVGEHRHYVGLLEELRALYKSDAFWDVAANFPHNDVNDHRFGRPLDFPDWALFLIVCAAGVRGVATVRSAVALFHDRPLWEDFVRDVDQYVPLGWTRLGDCVPSSRRLAAASRPRVEAKLTVVPTRKARDRQRKGSRPVAPVQALPPEPHHLAYWIGKWRGHRRVSGGWVRVEPGDEWHGVPERVFNAFRTDAARQAQDMGLFDPNQSFQFKRPDRHQYVGFDGVVFAMPDKRPSGSCETHTTGDPRKGKVYGTKFTLASTRTNGEYGSRLVLDLAHTGKGSDSDFRDEAQATVEMAKRLRDLTGGGMRGVIVDSVVRGEQVTELQRAGVTVVNYPHAAANPNRKQGVRHAAGRIEKSHMRTVARHEDAGGQPCEHVVFFLGGNPVEVRPASSGDMTVVPLTAIDYEQRPSRKAGGATGSKAGVRREYLIVRIPCSLVGDFDHRVPLFHTDAASADPDSIWGEVVRVFGPGTPAFQHLYGARNDTESRHTSLKARVKYLPPDVAGQRLRLLGASLVMNAVALHLHLQAHGQPNVLDNTA